MFVDEEARTVTIPAKDGRCAFVGLEDFRLSFPRDPFAIVVQEDIDSVEDSIYDATDAIAFHEQLGFSQNSFVFKLKYVWNSCFTSC